ncbi:unnamed protein product, partial [Ectocarpus sp. 12 AP-2014]
MELLVLDGDPVWSPVADTGLSYATNTGQALLAYEEQFFTLLSGRWFTAAELAGPWTYDSDLPAAFLSIPVGDDDGGHPLSYVRSSIPGTREAWEAALVASIPRTAVVKRGAEDELNVEVTYAGDPVFVPIEGAGIEYAANTSFQVLRYGNTYYLCYNATWLTSSSPEGPWEFADRIPDEFAQIPPESPLFNTTFVEIRDSNDESVEYAYTTGY